MPPGSGLGAGGAVTAVLVLFAFHFPWQRVSLWFVLTMPVWMLVVIFILLDSLGVLRSRSSGHRLRGPPGRRALRGALLPDRIPVQRSREAFATPGRTASPARAPPRWPSGIRRHRTRAGGAAVESHHIRGRVVRDPGEGRRGARQGLEVRSREPHAGRTGDSLQGERDLQATAEMIERKEGTHADVRILLSCLLARLREPGVDESP